MTGARVAIEGKTQGLGALGAIAARLADQRPMWNAIGAYGVTSTQRRFEKGVDPTGSRWPPSVRAIAEKGKTLVLTARLMQSQTFAASDVGVEWGTNVLYAAIHQMGGDINIPARKAQVHFKHHKRTGKRLPRFRKASKADETIDVTIPAHTVHMPRRAFLGLDDADEAEILNIAAGFIGGTEVKP